MNEIAITKERFKVAKKQFKSIKQECEGKVKSWFWASSDLYSLEPYYYERNKYPKGKVLKQEPQKKQRKCLYGVNEDGEIVVAREFTSLPEEYFYEVFYDRQSDFVEMFRFDSSDKHLIWIEQYWLQAGQVIKNQIYDEEKNWLIETYELYDGKITKSFRKHNFCDNLIESTFDYGYNEFGEISKILWNNKVCYVKPDKNKSVAQLIESSEERLFQLAFDYLKQSQIKEKLFAIALYYGNDNYFPPSIAMATEQQRIEWIAEKGERAGEIIWFPLEYEFNHDFENIPQEVNNLFELCNQEVGMQSKDSAARTAIARVAQRLNAQKTDFNFDVTNDFIIFATDYGLKDLRKNLKLIDPKYFDRMEKKLP